MPTDKQIKLMLSRQVRRFITEYVKKGPQEIADMMAKDCPGETITRQYINSQLNSPSWTFILWLETKHLNLEWLFKGEKDLKIPMIKLQ